VVQHSGRQQLAMKLTDIDLGGVGCFREEPASFGIENYFLQQPWDYILGDSRLYWRIHHNGCGYMQRVPPSGEYWLNATGEFDVPPFQVFVVPQGGDVMTAFTNFRGPQRGDSSCGNATTRFQCKWFVHKAYFNCERDGIQVETELGVAKSLPAGLMRVTITNRDDKERTVSVIPRVMPFLTSPQSAAWDMLWLYQSTRYKKDENTVMFHMGSPTGDPTQRKRIMMVVDGEFERICLNGSKFCGRGSRTRPFALSHWMEWDACDDALIYGKTLFASFARYLTLGPGESWSFVMGLTDEVEDSAPLKKAMADFEGEMEKMRQWKLSKMAQFSIKTPDLAFNRYVNEYLALQQQLILRRGWPCAMMGVRDSAQDHTGAVMWYPEETRVMLLQILEIERSDGWFVRQFSTDGRKGSHDTRPYVDAGLWVWELMYEYVTQTRDFDLLGEKLAFLDSDEETTVLDHLGRLLGYYTFPANVGEHGLCKIMEGDWNDSVNRAGLEGRGESVMVSCHLVYCLKQAAKLAAHIGSRSGLPDEQSCLALAGTMRKAIRKAALNAKGYLNGVFSDNGKWFFSDKDPDGCERFNTPVNAFGIIADIFEPSELPPLIERIKSLRQSFGYPLFTPAIGEPPMDGLGRIGSGDLPPGLGENGSAYNHGSHGFLARAMAECGEGDLYYDVMLCLFPYDQDRHPIAQSKTAPYAIVNVYKNAPDREGEGGDTFFSGTISVAVRNIYQGLLGVHAEPSGLKITPCLPSDWNKISGKIVYAGRTLTVDVERAGDGYAVSVDGAALDNGWYPAAWRPVGL